MKASDEARAEERGEPKHRTSYQENSYWLTMRFALQGAGAKNGQQTSNDAQLTCKEVDYILLKKKHKSFHITFSVIDIMKRVTKQLFHPIMGFGLL